MKKYDKIYVPDVKHGTFEVRDVDCEFPECNACERSNVIVLSKEELLSVFRDTWEEAQLSIDQDNGFDMEDSASDSTITKSAEEYFISYLKSKGI